MLKNLLACIVGAQVMLGSGLAYAQTSDEAVPFAESVWRVEHLLNQKKQFRPIKAKRTMPLFLLTFIRTK